jgi:hypothetical protein
VNEIPVILTLLPEPATLSEIVGVVFEYPDELIVSGQVPKSVLGFPLALMA